MYMYICICNVYIYIYIYIERERESERDVYTHVYIYIYIYMYPAAPALLLREVLRGVRGPGRGRRSPGARPKERRNLKLQVYKH